MHRLRCMAGGVSLAGGPGQQEGVLTASDVHVSNYPTVEALRWMGKTLEEESGGEVVTRVSPSGQLGRENDTIDLTRFGALDITRINFATLNNPFPATQILSLPYAVDSTAHLRRIVDGTVGRDILASFERRGLVGLAVYDSGTRCFYNRLRPVVEPADMKGLKIRVPPSDIFVRLVRALGANPTPLSYGEIFSALQTHLIDGAENNWTTFYTSRHFEVARFWAQSAHSYSPEALLMSQRRFSQLTARQQELVRSAAARSVPYMRTLWDSVEASSQAAVEKKGVRVTEVDTAAFRKAAATVLETYVGGDTSLMTLYERVRALA
jgi:tripartite ATP-independent transporter DctP family solute receptor